MNDVIYQNALAEIDYILTYSDKEVTDKISQKFLKMVKSNLNKDYKVNISTNKTLEEQDLLEETKTILSLIYRSYLATDEEKKLIAKKDKEEIEKIENKKIEDYPIENIFKRKTVNEDKVVSMEVIEIKENNIFKKIINNIINLLKKIK